MVDTAFYGSPSTFTNHSLDMSSKNGYHCWPMVAMEGFMIKGTAETNEHGMLVRRNIRLARRLTNRQLGTIAIERLRDLTKTFGFSLSLGDVQFLDGGWYITHAGLLRLSRRRRCSGIRVNQVRQLCDPVMGR